VYIQLWLAKFWGTVNTGRFILLYKYEGRGFLKVTFVHPHIWNDFEMKIEKMNWILQIWDKSENSSTTYITAILIVINETKRAKRSKLGITKKDEDAVRILCL